MCISDYSLLAAQCSSIALGYEMNDRIINLLCSDNLLVRISDYTLPPSNPDVIAGFGQ